MVVSSIFSLFLTVLFFLKPFPKRHILDYSKLKEFADDNFIFDKNGRKFFKLGRKTPWEFLLSQCFQKTCNVDKLKQGLVWERVNSFRNKLWFLRVCSTRLLKTVGKGEIATPSNFSCFHSFFFYPFGELSAIFIQFKIVVC